MVFSKKLQITEIFSYILKQKDTGGEIFWASLRY